MMNKRLLALMKKETLQMVRDPSSVLIGVILPLLLMFLYGYAVSLDMNHLKIGLVLEDHSVQAQSFAQSLSDSPYFITHLGRDRRDFVEDITRGDIRGIVVLPAYFSSFFHRSDHHGPIQVIADGSEPNTASFVQNYVQGAWLNWLQQEKLSSNLQGLPLVNAEPRFWYNEELESRYFLIPGSLAIIMTLIGTLLTALVVAREWERGTMEALMSTPAKISEIIIGKLIPYFCLGMLSMIICTAISVFYYEIPFRGSYLVLGFVTATFLLSALGIGLLISSAARTQFVAAQAAMAAAFLPSFILSGFIFEIRSMPKVIQWVTYLIPARYFVSSLQTLFLVGNVWSLLIPNILAMLGLGLFLIWAAARKIVKRLD